MKFHINPFKRIKVIRTGSLGSQVVAYLGVPARISALMLGTLTIVAALSNPWQARSQAAATDGAGGEAEKAWKEVEKATRPPMPPAEWQGNPTREQVEEFRATQGVLAGEAAEKAKDFYTKYPQHAKAADARKKEFQMLQFAVQLGNTNKMAQLDALEAQKLNDPNLSEKERFTLRFQSVQRAVGAKSNEGQEAMVAEQEKGARILIKEFPKRDEGYQWLAQVAAGSDETKGRELAKEIVASSASDEAKASAKGLLKKLDALGKPLPIQFTSVDGRKVDVTKMQGKVVLVDFWATWCGPCVGEIPHVKEAYERLHPKGFEIVGISFDSDKSKLENFVSEKGMTWPQYFDGKQWKNEIGQEYGINSIPAMWLIDKKGNLRDMNARSDLAGKVEKLLEEKMVAD